MTKKVKKRKVKGDFNTPKPMLNPSFKMTGELYVRKPTAKETKALRLAWQIKNSETYL